MYDNMSEFVAATMREDAAMWAKQRARVRAAIRENSGRGERRPYREVVAKALITLATRLAPTVTMPTSSTRVVVQ